MVCLAPRAREESVRPRRLSGVGARPLNFTVRGHPRESIEIAVRRPFVQCLARLARRPQRVQLRAPIAAIAESCSGVEPTPSLFSALGARCTWFCRLILRTPCSSRTVALGAMCPLTIAGGVRETQ